MNSYLIDQNCENIILKYLFSIGFLYIYIYIENLIWSFYNIHFFSCVPYLLNISRDNIVNNIGYFLTQYIFYY